MLKEVVLQPFVIELYAPALGSYIFRVASPYQSLPYGFILFLAVIAVGMIFFSVRELRSLEHARM